MTKKNLIPIFLDWTGTINEILSTDKEIGAIKLKNFFNSIQKLENNTDSKALITIVSGSSLPSNKEKLSILNKLAYNYGMPDLFHFIVAEYCGYLIENNGSISVLDRIPPDLVQKKEEIHRLMGNSSKIEINPDITTYINVPFPDEISRGEYNNYAKQIAQLCSNEYDFLSSFDEYGKELDIKSKTTTKQKAVTHTLPIILNQYQHHHIPFILTGGDTEHEDLPMALADTKGIQVIPITPSNNDLTQDIIQNLKVIVGNGKNIEGISDSINTISKIGKIK